MEEIIIEKLIANETPTSIIVIGLAIYVVRVLRRIEQDIHRITEELSDIRSQIAYIRGKDDGKEVS